MRVRLEVRRFGETYGIIPPSVALMMNGVPAIVTMTQTIALLNGDDPHKVMFPPGQLHAEPFDMRELAA